PELRLLEDDADPLAEARPRRLRVVPEHRHLTGVAAPVALEDLDRRRLAGAVRAEEAEDLAVRDLEVDAAHRLERAVRFAQSADGDCRHAETSSTSTWPQGGKDGSGPPLRAAAAWPQSGWWPTTSTVSPRPRAASRTSAGAAPGASRSSTCGSPRPSATAVSRARRSGLVTTASGTDRSSRRRCPSARACARPAGVSVRSSSGL